MCVRVSGIEHEMGEWDAWCKGRRGREGGYEVCGEWGALGAVGLEREIGDRGK